VTRFLATRKGLLDAVVFSGGEPTIQRQLPAAIREIKDMGFLTGLHTSGAFPFRMEELLTLLDWVGMDIKAPFEDYEMITGIPSSGKEAEASAQILIESGLSYEFRTTLHPTLTDDGGGRFLRLAHVLKNMGAKHFAIQQLRPLESGTLPGVLPFRAMEQIFCSIAPWFDSVSIRD
jgi:pyruvate formate lyase activating enzyme